MDRPNQGVTRLSFRTSAILGTTCLCLGFSSPGSSQSPVAQATSRADLQELAQRLQTLHQRDQKSARDWAAQAGVPLRRELPNGKILELQRLGPNGSPLFYLTYNTDAADSVSTDEVWPGGASGLSLTGAGLTVGEWDGGAVLVDHPEFEGRATQADGATEISDHATHVAGTLIAAGNGNYPTARGMAYAANLDAHDWNNDDTEMAAAAASGLLLSNHSYGIAAGWIYLGGAPPDGWWWIGGTGDEDPNFGYYDSQSQTWDQIAFNAPYYLIVKAAGNDRWDIGPQPEEEYTIVDQGGNPLSTSTVSRPADCAPAGYDCLPTASVAKNILTIGSVEDVIGGYNTLAGPASVQISGFSSWGPTDDGRIKPDLVGNGWLLWSTYGQNPYYTAALGTSMAAPNVTGSLLLLQQHYENLHGPDQFMTAATLKALAIHTADETGPADGPDYTYGWGLLNTQKAAELISEADLSSDPPQIIEGTLLNGQTHNYNINVSDSDVTVTATLVWTDPPGTPATPLVVDPPDLMLVNDLNLRISSAGDTYFPWALDPNAPADPATQENNDRDNVEQVEISGAAAGSYTVTVSHDGALTNGQQHYSLIVSIQPPPPVSQGLLINEDFSGGLPAGWSIETDYGISWTINDPIPGDDRLDNLTGGSGKFAIANSGLSAPATSTSLVTPEFDLSGVDQVSLQFLSFFCQWDSETGWVELSTDGGVTWNTRWQRPGFGGCTANSLVNLDLSAQLAGEPNAKIRFRYQTYFNNEGENWQIDNVELEVFGDGPPPPPPPPPDTDPPGQTDNPLPENGATGVATSPTLTWAAGPLATSHNVYLGTSSTLDSSDAMGSTSGNSMGAGPLAWDTTYFWRVDSVNDDGVTPGITWNFTTDSAPDTSIHVAGLTGWSVPGSRGAWAPTVTVSTADQDAAPAQGVTVQGNWSSGSGDTACVTSADGSCSLTGPSLKKRINNITFEVLSLSKSGYSYDTASNSASSVLINKDDVNQDLQPIAVNDSYTTEAGQELTGNVLDNDDQGDGPATINSNSNPANGALVLQVDGSFSYQPDPGFTEGNDGFSYTIIDSDGDSSGTANVSIAVTSEPPPPPSELSVTARPFKRKGVQHVELTWENFSGAQVAVSRDGSPIFGGATANDNAETDNIGVKGGGQTYNYQVCEIPAGPCASASASF